MGFEKTATEKDIVWRGKIFRPLATFGTGNTGRFQLVLDGGFYVLLGHVRGHGYQVRNHWFPEAVEAAFCALPAGESTLSGVSACPQT